jgi:uncharacterized protein YceH (UPF0502 family)
MPESMQLNSHEARVLGVLIEKELTTPDGYPLSLNALVLGANQKSNRDPVTDYSEAEVVVALTGLAAKHLSGRTMPAGSRVEKYHHSAREALGIDVAESAVLAELLMRGSQQPGELRTRAARMAALDTQEKLTEVLASLSQKGLARNLGRRQGERAERWGQTLAPEARVATTPNSVMSSPAPSPAPQPPVPAASARGGLEERVAALEERVAALERMLADLGG